MSVAEAAAGHRRVECERSGFFWDKTESKKQKAKTRNQKIEIQFSKHPPPPKAEIFS
jgi:hypothetical protein